MRKLSEYFEDKLIKFLSDPHRPFLNPRKQDLGKLFGLQTLQKDEGVDSERKDQILKRITYLAGQHGYEKQYWKMLDANGNDIPPTSMRWKWMKDNDALVVYCKDFAYAREYLIDQFSEISDIILLKSIPLIAEQQEAA